MAFKYFVVFAVVAFSIQVLSAFTHTKRSLASDASANGTTEEKEVCQGRTPCGWAVYNRMTRYVEYFMKNKCECSKEKRCLKDDEDISVTAYVYRCRVDDNAKNTS